MLFAPKLSAGAVLCSVAAVPGGDTVQEVVVFQVSPKVLPSVQNSLILADENHWQCGRIFLMLREGKDEGGQSQLCGFGVQSPPV